MTFSPRKSASAWGSAWPVSYTHLGISVRELEKLVNKANGKEEKKPPRKSSRIHYFDEVELALNEHLGRKVRVSGTKKRGTLQIEFYGEDDLAGLMKLFDQEDD